MSSVKVWKAKKGERRAATGVYVFIALFAIAFLYVIYRASQIIHASSSIDSHAYLLTHIGTFAVELILWFILARTAIHLKAYTRTVSGSEDGKALDYIANAFLLSLAYAMLFGVASTIKTLFWHTSNLSLVTNITNLLPAVVIVALSLLLYIGAVKFSRLTQKNFNVVGNGNRLASLIVFLGGALTYGWYLYQRAPQLLDDDGLHHFALSSKALVPTYGLLYVLAWLLGLLACLHLMNYAKSVKGTIYRRLFQNLYHGLVISFLGTYIAQVFYISNLASNRIGPGLIFILALLAFIIVGSLLVYRGTTQLDQIEEN